MLNIDAGRLPSVLIAAILIVVPMSGCLGGPGDGSDENVAWKGEYQVGDFIEYYKNFTNSRGSDYAILRMTVMNVTDTDITVNQSVAKLFDPGDAEYGERTILKNATLAFDTYFDPTNPIPNSTYTYLGGEVLSTEWGPRNCSHYNGTWHHKGVVVTLEFWLYKGVLMKAIDHSLLVVDPDEPPIESGNTLQIKDTNLEEITDQ
jgi:hypothetical protein